MSNIFSKFNKIRILAVRCKQTCPPPQEPRAMPAPHGRSKPPSQHDECPQSFVSPSTCKILTAPGPTHDCSFTYVATLDDSPLPCGWFTGRDVLLTSIYHRYFWIGLIIMTLSMYEFGRNAMVKKYNRNYQYYFDCDLDNKSLSSSVEISLEDVQSSNF